MEKKCPENSGKWPFQTLSLVVHWHSEAEHFVVNPVCCCACGRTQVADVEKKDKDAASNLAPDGASGLWKVSVVFLWDVFGGVF